MSGIIPARLSASAAWALLVGAGASFGAHAQGIALDGIIVTTTRTPEAAIDALGGASTIGRDELDAQFGGVDGIGSVVRTLPGVGTQDKSKDTAQAINLRGLQDFGRVNVLIEGARQNFQKSDHGANGAFYIEPEMLKRLDITRGPTATIYGSGAIGGVVAFELIDADDILRPGEIAAARSRTSYTTNGSGFMESGTGAVRVGAFDIVAQATGRWSDNYTDGRGRTVPNSEDTTTSYLTKMRWRPLEGHQLTFSALDYNSAFVDTVNSDATGTQYDTKVDNTQLTLGYRFARPDTPLADFSAKVYRNSTVLDQERLTGSATGTARTFDVETTGIDVNNTSRLAFGSTRLALTYGGDAFRDEVTNTDPSGNGDELTPSGRREVKGAFVQSKLNFLERFELITALRYDSYALDGGDTSLSGERISPKVTLGFMPLTGATLFATYAEGYRAPAVTETLIAGFHPAPFAFRLLPNPNLRPEVAHNVEGGLNLKYGGIATPADAFRAKLVAFQNKVDDYIDGVYSPSPPPFGQYQYQNIANATLRGVEIEAVYDARAWYLGVSAARIRGTNDDTGAPLLTIPADQITITAGLRAYDSKLSVGTRARLVAAQDRVPSGTTPSDGYTVIDLFGQYAVSDSVTLNLNVDNLLDKAYVQYRDQSYSAGLSARLGATVRLGVPAPTP